MFIKYLLIFIWGFLCISLKSQAFPYPTTPKIDQVDDYFGTPIKDPYRWLEDDNSEETKQWVDAQNTFTQRVLSEIPYRDKIKDRLKELINFSRYSLPTKAGEYLIYSKNDGLQNQAIYYKKNLATGTSDVLLDPNTMSSSGTVSINLVSYSKDKKYLTYLVSKAGSDWQEIKVIEIATSQILEDEVKWVKFSGAAWWANGFFYSRYPQAEQGKELTAVGEFHSVYYHKLGDDQSKDILVFKDSKNPLRNHSISISEDQKYVYLRASVGTSGTEIYYASATAPEQLDFKPLILGFDHRSSIIENIEDQIIALTNIDAPNYRLVKINLQNPQRDKWITLVPETAHLLESVSSAGGKLFVKYLEDIKNKVFIYDFNGKREKQIELPAIGSIAGFDGDKSDENVYYLLNSHISPTTIYKYEIASGKSEQLFVEENIDFNSEIVSEQVFFNSKDGTSIPIFLIYKKGLKKDGQRPVFLYGYGGFNISLKPGYDAFSRMIVENDGIYAIVNLRGGGEYGEKRHKAGMKEQKQNVFDDFIGAAEFLIREKYTSSEKLGIYGRSNGGLLVGACLTQRPDLFKVAFPAVGVLDMLRFHKFTIGWAWATEYGSSEKEEDFKYLIKYSPLHNIKPIKYPATMVLTSDHDDRVVPAHSFKFGAALQNHQKGDKPILIRIETEAGHGAGNSLSKTIEMTADMYAFFFYHTNTTPKF